MVRRFGPTLGAGVAIIEKAAEKLIEPALLGVTGYVGILEKGNPGELITARNPTEFRQRAGSRIPASLLPDSAFDFFEHGQGAGELHLSRVTDGTERVASVVMKTRQTPLRTDAILVEAHSPGRWAGKQQTVAGQYVSTTNTTLDTGKTLKEDEFKGGTLTLAELPGQAFPIEGNSIAGVITLPADSTLFDDLAASGGGDQTYALVLTNAGKEVTVLFKNGLEKPDTEWGMDVFENEELVKEYPNLSSDPDSARYFEPIVNDDTSNVWVKLTDQFTGTISPAIRPANFSGLSSVLTVITLSKAISEVQVVAVSGTPTVSFEETPGSAVQAGAVSLTVSTVGTRPEGTTQVSVNPSDSDTLTLDFSAADGVTGTKVITFKTVVTDPTTEVLIGVDQAATAANLQLFLAGMTYAEDYFNYTVLTDTVTFVALDPNDLHNAGTEFTESGVNFVFAQLGTAVAGVDMVLDYTSAEQADLPATTVTPGKAFTAPNAWLMGGMLHLTSLDNLALADFISLVLDPFPVNGLVGGFVTPKTSDRRNKFEIVSNTADTITVKTGVDMTALGAAAGDQYLVEAAIALSDGYDGHAGVDDQDYIDAWDANDAVFNALFGKNKGLVKLGTPGVTSTAVQKAGASYAESRNYQYRDEVPASITTEDAAEAYINETLGRNDFAVVSFPSFGYVTDPDGEGGLKLVSLTGMIHGREALVAKNFQGFFKAAAGIDVTLPNVLKLPTGDKILNEEVLNPQGINVVKFKDGNVIIWGDRTVSIDPGWKWKHQREYMSHIEHILSENFDFIIFALNNLNSQTQVQTTLTAFFLGQFQLGAFEGDDFTSAVRIKIDGENNTTLTRAQGDLNAEITIRIVNTIERLQITIGKAGIFEDLSA